MTKDAPDTSAQSGLKTVDRALQVLQLLARGDEKMSVKAISATLGLNLTTTYHLVNSLAQRGFVAKQGTSVSLGHTVALLGAAYGRQFRLADVAATLIKGLRDSTGETSYLASWTNRHVVIQLLEEGDRSIRVGGLYVGFAGDEHRRASGLAVLAMLSEAELRSYLDGMPTAARKTTTGDGWKRELDVVREAGYAVERGNFNPGVACAAAPFFASPGQVAGAIAVSAPVDRFEQSFDSLLRHVQHAALAVNDLYAGTPSWSFND